MANDLTNPQTLSPSEVTRIFSGMSPAKATRYYNKCMTNPNTPKRNMDMLRQYRTQNESKFLSDEQMRGNRGSKGSWTYGKGYSGGYRNNGRVYDSDGYSYDNNGRTYDQSGNERGGYHDGGSERRDRGNPNGFSNYYGGGKVMRRYQKRPVSEARSYEDIHSVMSGLKSDVARTRYFMKVARNPETNPDTLNNIVRYRNSNPTLFASDEDAKAAGPVFTGRAPRKHYNNQQSPRRSWGSFWKSKEQFESMSPKKQKHFVRAYKKRNTTANAAYSLKVLVNPASSGDDKQAVTEVVNENPGMFFKGSQQR